MVDHMGNQVLGVPQMHLGMDAEQLRQLGYDPETIQVTTNASYIVLNFAPSASLDRH